MLRLYFFNNYNIFVIFTLFYLSLQLELGLFSLPKRRNADYVSTVLFSSFTTKNLKSDAFATALPNAVANTLSLPYFFN
jgi:uncharacterized membrane protein YGL010W